MRLEAPAPSSRPATAPSPRRSRACRTRRGASTSWATRVRSRRAWPWWAPARRRPMARAAPSASPARQRGGALWSYRAARADATRRPTRPRSPRARRRWRSSGAAATSRTRPTHAGLFQRIVDGGGAVVSEQPWDRKPRPYMFRQRNRLIAGLARAVLIVEAGLPSGTFSTADEALAANRDVLVVPGAITAASSRGANRLLYQGAHARRGRRDVRGRPVLPVRMLEAGDSGRLRGSMRQPLARCVARRCGSSAARRQSRGRGPRRRAAGHGGSLRRGPRVLRLRRAARLAHGTPCGGRAHGPRRPLPRRPLGAGGVRGIASVDERKGGRRGRDGDDLHVLRHSGHHV